MRRVGVVAAAGNGRRTGLGDYTSKAALPLRGRPLLLHTVDFLRRSGVDVVHVVTQGRYSAQVQRVLRDGGVDLLRDWGVEATEDLRRRMHRRLHNAQVLAHLHVAAPNGWVGAVEVVMPHVEPSDEVILVSCDNYHTVSRARSAGEMSRDAIFTYTRLGLDEGRTGTVFGRVGDSWETLRSADHAGDAFTGYVCVVGDHLLRAIPEVPVSSRGEKEIAGLLEVLSRTARCGAVPYGGTYEDVADLRALASLDVRLRGAVVADGVALPSSDRPGDARIDAVVVFADPDGQALLTRCAVDDGEKVASVAARGAFEETGVAVREQDLRLLGVYQTIGDLGEPVCSVVFRARVLVLPVRRGGRTRDSGSYPYLEDAASWREMDARPIP